MFDEKTEKWWRQRSLSSSAPNLKRH